jgi:hypothetical protein
VIRNEMPVMSHDAVLIVPGIMGSTLWDTERDRWVWGTPTALAASWLSGAPGGAAVQW